jgi:hypothetical protein
MSIPCAMVNRPAAPGSAGSLLLKSRAVHGECRCVKHARSILTACLLAAFVFALPRCAPAQQPIHQQAAPAGVAQRYGNFSIVWPASPRLVENPVTSTTSAAVYAVTLTPYTYTFSFLQFSSPQEMVSPKDFARNQTSSPPGATILNISTTKLAGYPADEVIYRIGQVTYLAWSVQPTRQVDYVITSAGPDSPAFRQRAVQFASTFARAQ